MSVDRAIANMATYNQTIAFIHFSWHSMVIFLITESVSFFEKVQQVGHDQMLSAL